MSYEDDRTTGGGMDRRDGTLDLRRMGVPDVKSGVSKSDVSKSDVSENDKLQFTQKEVQALMQELQERMFHLAELTKQAEPDNSTRLLLALRKAREQLIIEQMREVLEKLNKKDMSKATADTKEVLRKLAELKALLIAADLELQLQLERLRQLQAAIRQLDVAIKDEKGQQSESGRMAGLMKKGSDVKPQDLDRAKQNQVANRGRTGQVSQAVKSLGESGFGPAIARPPRPNRCRKPREASAAASRAMPRASRPMP